MLSRLAGVFAYFGHHQVKYLVIGVIAALRRARNSLTRRHKCSHPRLTGHRSEWWYGAGMSKADLHRLIDSLPDDIVARLQKGILITLAVTHDGERLDLREIDPEQAWFWTPEWQAREREVDESIARGERGEAFSSDEEFLDALDRDLKPLAE